MDKKIYLDYAATTPVDPQVLEAMLPCYKEKFGNPMSVHSFGRDAVMAIDEAREKVVEFLGASGGEVIFTSGATESNNLAIKGVVKAFSKKSEVIPHIITSQIEHHCVLDVCKNLEKEGKAEVTFLPVHEDGLVKLWDVEKAIKENTLLISVMQVNNEIGTVQPIAEIGQLVKKMNEDRQEKIIFHTDATQAINYFDANVDSLNVDLLSFSGHKIYGPKGVGVLYIRKGTPIMKIQEGGDQEYKMRAGTHNVPGIIGLAKAVELISQTPVEKIKELRDYAIKRVLAEIDGSYLNGSQEKRSPNNVNFRFDNVEGEGLLLSLDMEGIAVSTGSACSSGALDPSHVLLALGLKHEQAHGSLRMTFGKETEKEDVDFAIDKLKEVVGRLRKISGDVLAEFK